MAEIRVNSEMLRSASAEIKQQGNNFNDLMSQVSQILTSINWEGSASESFKEKVNALKPTMERYYQVITEYGQFLETSAEQYEQAEQQAQSTTDSLANNLFS